MIVRSKHGKKLFSVPGKSLCRVNQSYSILHWADLRYEDLREASFMKADLRYAWLMGTNLQHVDFTDADLRYADLRNTCLLGAEFDNAKVYGVRWPAPTEILLANWGEVSQNLCRKLMRYDASNHPDPKSFLRWAMNGRCPYSEINFQRAALFAERANVINNRFLQTKVETAYNLVQMLLKEKCICDKGAGYMTP